MFPAGCLLTIILADRFDLAASPPPLLNVENTFKKKILVRRTTRRREKWMKPKASFYKISKMSTDQHWIRLNQDWSQFWPELTGSDCNFLKICPSTLDRIEKFCCWNAIILTLRKFLWWSDFADLKNFGNAKKRECSFCFMRQKHCWS